MSTRRRCAHILAWSSIGLPTSSQRICTMAQHRRDDVGHTFGRQALPMVWDYAEVNPFSGRLARLAGALDWMLPVSSKCARCTSAASAVARHRQRDCRSCERAIDAIVTDPPYYDSVPYSDLSDFFYVWLKRIYRRLLPEHCFARHLLRKQQEIIAYLASANVADAEDHANGYENGMAKALSRMHSVMSRCQTALLS